MRFKLKEACGKHRMPGPEGNLLILLPGSIVDCDAADLGGAISKFEQIDPDPEPGTVRSEWRVEAIGDGGYNVISVASGLPLNDAPLTAQEAADIAGVPIGSFVSPAIVDGGMANVKDADG